MHNAGCKNRRFAERHEFTGAKAKKSKRLIEEIRKIAENMSAMIASAYLRESVAKVGKSSICELLKKDGVKIERSNISKVCIDDFALKKGRSYGTVMIDIEKHEIIDMIATREQGAVSEWLRGYENLSNISRDGSISYRGAIEAAHSEAAQISDRFHL